jgi:cytochrome c-type biogenesis protein CcmH
MKKAKFKMQNETQSGNFNFFILQFSFYNAAVVLAFFLSLWILPAALAAQSPDLDEQTRAIASELRCPVCQNNSVADSPSELAQQMRALIQEQLKEGKSPAEIRAFFVSKYGDWVLLAPPARGLGLLLWLLPFVALGGGILGVGWFVGRWAKRRATSPGATAARDAEIPLLESANPREYLASERERLHAELKELEFDFQAGKLSQADYDAGKLEIETVSALVRKRMETVPARAIPPRPARPKQAPAEAARRSLRTWQIVGGAVFLLVFGITIGVFLTKSLRPRSGEQDTMTGGFLTGTQWPGDAASLVAQGRAFFERRDYAPAIEAFKKALAVDPNQPEAHAYLGMILAQAGHAEGAIMAFDKALAVQPDFPLALWGKGMLLYQTKSDPAAARETLQRLAAIMPPGPAKTEVEKAIADLSRTTSDTKRLAQSTASKPAATPSAKPAEKPAPAGGAKLQGIIDVDPKLKSKVESQAVLFIIARPAGGGPPIAAKRIARPTFPLAYSLGPEDAMSPAAPFSGKVMVSARLDKDGDPMTRGAGDLSGEYKKNPVEIGSTKVEIVLDQAQ